MTPHAPANSVMTPKSMPETPTSVPGRGRASSAISDGSIKARLSEESKITEPASTPVNSREQTLSKNTQAINLTPSKSLLKLLHSSHGWSLESYRKRNGPDLAQVAGWTLESPIIHRKESVKSAERKASFSSKCRHSVSFISHESKDGGGRMFSELKGLLSSPLDVAFGRSKSSSPPKRRGSMPARTLRTGLIATRLSREHPSNMLRRCSGDTKRLRTRSRSFSELPALHTLDQCLQDPVDKARFKAFLEKILALESLNFLDTVAAYKTLKGFKARKAAALNIIGEFLADEAPQQLNVSDVLLNQLFREATKGSFQSDLFYKIERAIYNLVEKDSFLKFQNLQGFHIRTKEEEADQARATRNYLRLRHREKSYILVPHLDSQDDLQSIKQEFWSHESVRTRWYKLQRWHSCFRGQDLVEWLMVSRDVPRRHLAIVIGQRMIDAGLVTQLSGQDVSLQEFHDTDALYYFPGLVSRNACARILQTRSCVSGFLLIKGQVYYNSLFAVLSSEKKKMYFYNSKMDQAELFSISLVGAVAFVSRERSTQAAEESDTFKRAYAMFMNVGLNSRAASKRPAASEDNKGRPRSSTMDDSILGRNSGLSDTRTMTGLLKRLEQTHPSTPKHLLDPDTDHPLLDVHNKKTSQGSITMSSYNSKGPLMGEVPPRAPRGSVIRTGATSNPWTPENSIETDHSLKPTCNAQMAKTARGDDLKISYVTLATNNKRVLVFRFDSHVHRQGWLDSLSAVGVEMRTDPQDDAS